MIKLDFTILIQMVNFLVCLLVLNYLLFRPVIRIIEERKKRIEESEKETRTLKEKREERKREYERKLEEVKLQALEDREKLRKDGMAKAREILAQTRQNALEIFTSAKERIGQDIKIAAKELEHKAKDISMEIVEKLLGRKVT